MQYKADGYILSVPSRSAGAPRNLLQVTQDGTPTKQVSDKHQAVKQVWQLVGDDVQAG